MTLTRVVISAACLFAAGNGSVWAQTATSWKVEGSRAAPPFRLYLPDAGGGMSYIFDCSGTDLLVIQTGVTGLLDLKAGNNARVPDTGEGRVFPEGSALMAVATDRSQPDFTLGVAKPNAVKGWDIAILLSRKDKSVSDFGRAELVSLFTTGFTAAVVLEKADKKIMSDFVKECRK